MRERRASTEIVTRLKEMGINRRVSLDDMEEIVAVVQAEKQVEIERLLAFAREVYDANELATDEDCDRLLYGLGHKARDLLGIDDGSGMPRPRPSDAAPPESQTGTPAQDNQTGGAREDR